jgi:hypothetical protein
MPNGVRTDLAIYNCTSLDNTTTIIPLRQNLYKSLVVLAEVTSNSLQRVES